MQQFKGIFATSLSFFLSISLFAQQPEPPAETLKVIDVPQNNIIKINLSALVFKNISVQYERKVAEKITVAANVHYMIFGSLPFRGLTEKIINDPNVPADKFKMGGTGFTTEVRFYVGKKGALQGFYLAPFANFTSYKANLPINYENDTKTGIFSGNISTFTGGLLLGAQWKLGKSLYLDWWILGPNYGGSKGDLNFNASLSVTEQDELRNQIEEVKADAPFDKIIDSYTVKSDGAFIKAKGPWAGLRGLGFNLGFRF